MIWQQFRPSLTLLIFFGLLTGVIYPLAILGIGQTIFPSQANGSLIEVNGKIIGSSLIGQNFTSDAYFHPRPSYAGNGYDATASGGSNLGPTSKDMLKAIDDRVAALKKPDTVSVPVDFVTGSGSGLDPDISPATARFQAAHVAEARRLSTTQVEEIISHNIASPDFGILGENRVNVLQLNRALDEAAPVKP